MKKTINVYYEVGQIVRILPSGLEGKISTISLNENLEVVYIIYDTFGDIHYITNPIDLLEIKTYSNLK